MCLIVKYRIASKDRAVTKRFTILMIIRMIKFFKAFYDDNLGYPPVRVDFVLECNLVIFLSNNYLVTKLVLPNPLINFNRL